MKGKVLREAIGEEQLRHKGQSHGEKEEKIKREAERWYVYFRVCVCVCVKGGGGGVTIRCYSQMILSVYEKYTLIM